MADDAAKTKSRRPTAQKREIQNAKKNARNSQFKSRVRTSVRSFREAVKDGNAEETQKALCQVYSLMDKGVKRGVFKLNTVSRTKSRLSAQAAK